MDDVVCGYRLDEQQMAIVKDDSKYLLVVAGAGSGKTLTILGKIKYLLYQKNIKPDDILCISFTRASTNSLKEKIKKEFLLSMPVYTFHELALNILKDNQIEYNITDNETLDRIIHDFFNLTILNYPQYMKYLLSYFNKFSFIKLKRKYQKFYIVNYKKIQLLERLINTFIRLFKCNNYTIEDYSLFLKQIKKTFNYKKYKKEKIFLILSLNIYLLYFDYLKENKEIDFDDMIIKATKLVKDNGKVNKYKYVIIDEYQDTSFVRFCLIKEILAKTNAKLMVVGDDFQSIYRFTGCDLNLFLNFSQYFKESKMLKIENTYRNSQELINIAGKFIMKNKNQIRKNLKSSKHIDNPIIVIYYDNIVVSIKELFNKLEGNIMILGRNNNDIYSILDNDIFLKDNKVIYKNNSKLNMYYMTVHKSKGLEEDNVIIINLEDKLLGFPNKIVDDRVLRLVNKTNDKFLYSEERRLFYVALTRTKNRVYLLVPKKNPSIFIKNLFD